MRHPHAASPCRIPPCGSIRLTLPTMVDFLSNGIDTACFKGYIAFVAAILLTRAASRFDSGSGTPTPQTSTAFHFLVALPGGLTFL